MVFRIFFLLSFFFFSFPALSEDGWIFTTRDLLSHWSSENEIRWELPLTREECFEGRWSNLEGDTAEPFRWILDRSVGIKVPSSNESWTHVSLRLRAFQPRQVVTISLHGGESRSFPLDTTWQWITLECPPTKEAVLTFRFTRLWSPSEVDPESNDRRFLAAALSRVLISRGNPSSLNPSFSWKGDQLYLNPGAAIHGILPLPENFTWTFTTNSPLDLSARQFHTTLSGSTVVRRKLMGETYPLVRIANPSPDRTAILTVSGQWTRTDRKKGNRIYMFFGRGIQESDLFSLTHIRSDYQLSWIEASVAEDAFGYIAEGSDLAPHTMPPLPILLLPAGFFPAVVPCPAMKTFSQKDEPSEYSPNLIQIDLGDLSSSFFDLPRISQTRFWMENNGPLFLTPEGALTLNVVVNPGENTFILQREDPTGFVDAFVVNRAEIQSAQVATLTLSDGWMESGTRKMLLRRGKITVISSEREAHTATICLRGVERIHPSRRESIRRERLNDLEQTLLTLKSKQTKADNLWIFLFLGEAETSRYLYMCRGPADTSDIGNLARTIATFLQMDERDLPPRFFPR